MKSVRRLSHALLAQVVFTVLRLSEYIPCLNKYFFHRLRSQCAIIVESGEVREVHQICCLLGYGTDAIAPYMVFEIVQMLREEKILDCHLTDDAAYSNYKGAVDRGISKIMAKMGISVLQSYKGAQIFEAVGLAQVMKCLLS